MKIQSLSHCLVQHYSHNPLIIVAAPSSTQPTSSGSSAAANLRALMAKRKKPSSSLGIQSVTKHLAFSNCVE